MHFVLNLLISRAEDLAGPKDSGESQHAYLFSPSSIRPENSPMKTEILGSKEKFQFSLNLAGTTFGLVHEPQEDILHLTNAVSNSFPRIQQVQSLLPPLNYLVVAASSCL